MVCVREQIDDLENEAEDLGDQVSDLEQEVYDLKSDVEMCEATSDTLEDEAYEYRETLESAKTDLLDLQNDLWLLRSLRPETLSPVIAADLEAIDKKLNLVVEDISL